MKLLIKILILLTVIVVYAGAVPNQKTFSEQGFYSAEFWCNHSLEPQGWNMDLGNIFADGIKKHPSPPVVGLNFISFHITGQQGKLYHIKNESFNRIVSIGGGNVTLDFHWVSQKTGSPQIAYPEDELIDIHNYSLYLDLTNNDPCKAQATFTVYADWLTADLTALPGTYYFELTLSVTPEGI